MHSCLVDIGIARSITCHQVILHIQAMQGSYQEAYDVLDSSYEKSTQQFQRAAVCGFLRHAQVSEVCTSSSCTVSQYVVIVPCTSHLYCWRRWSKVQGLLLVASIAIRCQSLVGSCAMLSLAYSRSDQEVVKSCYLFLGTVNV